MEKQELEPWEKLANIVVGAPIFYFQNDKDFPPQQFHLGSQVIPDILTCSSVSLPRPITYLVYGNLETSKVDLTG